MMKCLQCSFPTRYTLILHSINIGFCTPGIVVALYSLFANNTSKEYIEEHLDGNLCRCTGYRPIWDAAKSLCTSKNTSGDDGITRGPCGTPCRECPERKECDMECNISDKEKEEADNEEEKKESEMRTNDSEPLCCSTSDDKMTLYQKTLDNNPKWLQQPDKMFPEELKNPPSSSLMVVDRTYHKAGTWFKPTTLEELLKLLKQFEGGCKIVVGNTEVGIETKFKHSVFPRLVSPSHSIKSIYSIGINEQKDHLVIGSCVPLSTIQHTCSDLSGNGDFGRTAKALHDMLRWFASSQIRNVASLGGNLATASPINDMNPMLACMNAKLIIASMDEGSVVSRRSVAVKDFFVSYRTVDMKPYELIETIQVPKPKAVLEYIFPFKQARRREDDISIVTSGMRIILRPQESKGGDEACYIIDEASLAFGGMAAKTVMAATTANYLVGKPFTKETFASARRVLQKELNLPDDVPGGQAQYRKALASSFLHKFFFKIVESLKEDVEAISSNPALYVFDSEMPMVPVVDVKEEAAFESFIDETKPSTCGVQKFPKPRVYTGIEGKRKDLPMAAKAAKSGKEKVGQASSHASGPLHCTGEALYTDDIPLPPGSLHASLIMAKSCDVKFLSIDSAKALDTPGVVAVYTYEDLQKLGGDNIMGPIQHDEFVFLPMGERVHYVGQPLGICIADSLESSEAGARAVEVEYGQSIRKCVVSIEDAIEAGSFYDFARHCMERSLPVEINSDDKVIEVAGSFRCGGQEHFYLECNSTLAVPSESATNLTIYCSTQAVTKTQTYCASATNTPASKVVVRMKRMVSCAKSSARIVSWRMC